MPALTSDAAAPAPPGSGAASAGSGKLFGAYCSGPDVWKAKLNISEKRAAELGCCSQLYLGRCDDQMLLELAPAGEKRSNLLLCSDVQVEWNGLLQPAAPQQVRMGLWAAS